MKIKNMYKNVISEKMTNEKLQVNSQLAQSNSSIYGCTSASVLPEGLHNEAQGRSMLFWCRFIALFLQKLHWFNSQESKLRFPLLFRLL